MTSLKILPYITSSTSFSPYLSGFIWAGKIEQMMEFIVIPESK